MITEGDLEFQKRKKIRMCKYRGKYNRFPTSHEFLKSIFISKPKNLKSDIVLNVWRRNT